MAIVACSVLLVMFPAHPLKNVLLRNESRPGAIRAPIMCGRIGKPDDQKLLISFSFLMLTATLPSAKGILSTGHSPYTLIE